MTSLVARRGLEPGLILTLLVSAALHGLAVALVLSAPRDWLTPPAPMESYTVDLVAPEIVGGTNLLAGGRLRQQSEKPKPAPPVAAEPPMPSAPPVSGSEMEAVAPAAAAKPEPEKANVLEPPKPAKPPKVPDAPKVADVPKPPEPPKPAERAVAEPAKPPAEKVEEAKPPVAPQPAAEPAPRVANKEPPPVARPKAPEPPKQVAKAVEPPKPAAPANPATGADRAPESSKKPGQPAKPEAQQRDDAIAAAVHRRAAQVPSGGTANPGLDQQIAAAVHRRAQQSAAAGGTVPGPGGPIGVGPREGAGGKPADLEYILYEGRLRERIRAAWAWAGADKSLQAVIEFHVSPEGQITNVRTAQSSGDPRYDASCERAVRAVNPLEPVPEKYRKDFSTFELTFLASDLES